MNDTFKNTELNDAELDQLLSYASRPLPPADFEQRLLAKLSAAPMRDNVVAFPVQQKRKSSLWLAGLPLAASLVLGLWLGSNETASGYLPFSADTLTQNITSMISPKSTDVLDYVTQDNMS